MKRALVLLAIACGGSVDDGDQPDPGWCCDGVCGLTGVETAVFAECVCDAVVRRSEALRGECTEEP
jgi:hypothetical protein